MNPIKIELDTDTAWAAIWIAALTAFTVIAVTLTAGYNKRTIAALERGYSEVQIAGTRHTMWVKTN